MTEFTMNEVHPTSAVDRGVQGVLGQPLDRRDGPAKVTGTAIYAGEAKHPGLAHGVAITATIGAGRVTGIDAAAALALPGVIDIITDDPRIPSESPVIGVGHAPRFDGRVASYGMIVGIAVAESFEQARAAARAVRLTYAAERPATDTLAARAAADPPHEKAMLQDVAVGDLDEAMAAADIAIDVEYSTPHQVHAAMEPHAAIASWNDDALTLEGSIQIIRLAKMVLAGSVDVAPDKVRIVSPYIGGGFGGKIGGAEMVLAAIAAQKLGRPVKVQLTRRQLFHSVYGRSDTHQRLRLAGSSDGVLSGIGQDSLVSQKHGVAFFEPVALGAVSLYQGAARSFSTRIAKLNVTPAGAVRAPGEAVGMMGLECAMDELAEALDLDPIELRRRNEPKMDPTNGKPFSSRRLLDCFDEGARRFGWERHMPGSRRQGDWLIGTGMATAARVNFLADSSARVRLEPDGQATIETDMTDIGTGTYTILAQVAAEALGLPIDGVDVRLGDSLYPAGAGSGGSFGAASSASSVLLACEDIAGELARRMDADVQDLTLKDGHAIAGNRRVPLTELLAGKAIEAIGTIHPGSNNRQFTQATHGAQFAEVWVSAVSGECRVKRMVGVFDCGRILNHKTARSQAIGGMIWGLGYALHEEAHIDPRTGRYANDDLGEYLIPTQADVPQIEAYFVEEIDRHANPVGAKGLGELGISGAGAAVANAIYNACGVRVRDFPITCDKLLAGLPDL